MDQLAKILNRLVSLSSNYRYKTDSFVFTFSDFFSESKPDNPHPTGRYKIIELKAAKPVRKFTVYGVRSTKDFYSPDLADQVISELGEVVGRSVDII